MVATCAFGACSAGPPGLAAERFAHRAPPAASVRIAALEVSAATALDPIGKAEKLAAAGNLAEARAVRDHTALLADPAGRAAAIQRIELPRSPAEARDLARERLRTDDLPAARALLHSARRAAPRP
ncbi:MAG: hypothetical protein KDC98_00365, partial [Planctomycetes bacterium]|nr:hypothetical protein [Planctomycetota bacterium]